MCWTCFFPFSMKVRDQTSWPWSCAQWQVDFPQRRWERESEPGSAWSGIVSRRSSSNLRWRSREARDPRGSLFIVLLYYRLLLSYCRTPIRYTTKQALFATAEIGSYCRGTKELQERPVLMGQSILRVLNIPKLLWRLQANLVPTPGAKRDARQ
jgi:hypothetical protein